MMDDNDREILDALKQSLPPVNPELARDLWPDVLRRLDTHSLRVPWYDWVLIAMCASVFLIFPRLIFVFAYHL